MKKSRDVSASSTKQQSPLETLQAQMHCYETIAKPLVERKGQEKDKQRERQKRKRKNQNKKEKQRTKKQQALSNLKRIIRSFYRRETNFSQKRSIIEKCLQIQSNEEKFYASINQVIRQQVDVKIHLQQIISGQIHSLTKKLYALYIAQQKISPQMISDLSDKIEIVEEASPEIEKVINCFNKKNHKGINDHRNLDKLTFKFIFGNDEYKEHFEQLCEWIVQTCTDQIQSVLVKRMIDLLQIIQEFDEQYSSSEQQQEISESNFEQLQKIGYEMEKQNISNKKKKKNKKYSVLDEPLSHHIVIEHLQKMRIANEKENGKRIAVVLDKGWLQELGHRVRQKL